LIAVYTIELSVVVEVAQPTQVAPAS
jgi:hypothetical protein